MIAICGYCKKEKKVFLRYRWGKVSCEDCYKKKKMGKRSKKLKKGVKRVTFLKDELDRKFSIYIKCLFRKENGKIDCYTCGAELPIQGVQCGHFNSRKDACTRWLIDNARPQCPICNEGLSGNLDIFKEKLEAENPGITGMLEQMSRKVCNFTKSDLENMLQDITAKTKGIYNNSSL